MKSKQSIRSIHVGFGPACILILALAMSATTAFAQTPVKSPAIPADINQFVGKWSAVHNGTTYFLLEFHNDNGTLAGGIRVCAFTIGEGDHPEITITNERLGESLPIRNVAISGKSLTFDWKDPDGDENHFKFERTEENSGRLNWRELPADAKMPVIALTRQTAKTS